MNERIAVYFAVLLFTFLSAVPLARADEAPTTQPTTMDVWPAKAPGDAITVSEEWKGKRVTNVSHPTLTIFRPDKDKDTGIAIIVCPGGGYKALMMDYEGEDVARWLNTIGITSLVLKYRVPAPENTVRWKPALQDAQRAISIVRAKAEEWKIKPDHIGILGFSAGGHLAAAASTNYDQRAYDAADDTDKASCRPDFAVVIYPGGVVEKTPEGKVGTKLSAEIRVTDKTPPMFIAQATDDRVGPENSVELYLALKQAGVPAELHLYATGGHGFGIKKTDKTCATWPQSCADWMKSLKLW